MLLFAPDAKHLKRLSIPFRPTAGLRGRFPVLYFYRCIYRIWTDSSVYILCLFDMCSDTRPLKCVDTELSVPKHIPDQP